MPEGPEEKARRDIDAMLEKAGQKYLFWYLMSYRSELLKKRFGGAQKNISQTVLKQVPIPLPPFKEQHQIVSEVERLLSVADEASQTVEREIKRAERLRQSILKQAFSGQLISSKPSRLGHEVEEEMANAPRKQVEMRFEAA